MEAGGYLALEKQVGRSWQQNLNEAGFCFCKENAPLFHPFAAEAAGPAVGSERGECQDAVCDEEPASEG